MQRKARSAGRPMMTFWATLLTVLLLGAGCGEPANSPVRLGEDTVPALAAHPTGKRATDRMSWARRVAKGFGTGASRWALSRWVVITQTESTASDRSRLAIQALRADSGRPGRTHVLRETLQAPFVVEHDRRPLVLVLQERGKRARLRAIDAVTGRAIWDVPAGLGADFARRVRFDFATASGDLLIAKLARTAAGRSPCAVCALDLATGQLRWTHPGMVEPAANFVGALSVGSSSVAAFVGDGAGKYVVIDLGTGKLLASAPWTRLQQSDPTTLLALRTGFLALAAPDQEGNLAVRALDGRGRICWEETVRRGGVAVATPVSVALPTLDGAVEARELLTGKRRWRISAADIAASELVLTVNAGTRVTGAVATLAITLDGNTGQTLWAGRYSTTDTHAWNGHTYFGWAPDGRLAAYQSNGLPPIGSDIELGDIPIFLDS